MPEIPDESTPMDHLMHHIKDTIYFMDRAGKIVMVSDSGAQWLGFNSPEEVVGKTDSVICWCATCFQLSSTK